MEISYELLYAMGIGLGALTGGYGLGRANLPFSRKNGNGNGNSCIEKSEKTGGAKHISEESLGKIGEINRRLQNEYMTIAMHSVICAREKSDMRLYIAETMGGHTRAILEAIKGEKERGTQS